MNKKIITLFILLIALAVVSIVFRSSIPWLTQSVEEKKSEKGPVVTATPPVASDTPPVDDLTSKSQEPVASTKKEEQIPTKVSSLPVYVGRDPREVRPLEEEVKLFSEDQKKRIYLGIDNNGQAVKDNPDFLFGWIQLGLLKKMIGDYEGARDAWEYAGLIRPLNSVSFGNLGELYWRYLSDFQRSEKNLKISIKNKPSEISTYVSLSDLYYYSYKEKKDLADDVLLEGVAANPHDANFLRAVAALYERDGDMVRAIEWWKKVLEKEPNNTAVAAAITALEKKQAP